MCPEGRPIFRKGIMEDHEKFDWLSKNFRWPNSKVKCHLDYLGFTLGSTKCFSESWHIFFTNHFQIESKERNSLLKFVRYKDQPLDGF